MNILEKVKDGLINGNMDCEQDISLIRFNDILTESWVYKKYRPIIIGGKYEGCIEHDGKSYFVFVGAATSHNTSGRDKFFEDVSDFAEELRPLDGKKKSSVLVEKVLYFPRHIPENCQCRHCQHK